MTAPLSSRDIGRLPMLRRIPAAWIVVATVVLALPAAAQDSATATSGDPRAIATIRARYAAIERGLASYRRTTHDVYDFSVEGGTLDGYYSSAGLRKLRARLYGETWRGTEEYYFRDGQLLFIYVVHERYDEPMSGRIRVRLEYRFYFDRGRLIRRTSAQRPAGRSDDVVQFAPHVRDLQTTARLFAACAAATGADPKECHAPPR